MIVTQVGDECWPLNEDGVWIELRQLAQTEAGPVLFLDRDGVVNEDTDHVCDPKDIVLMSGAAELIATVNRQDIPVAVITNQSGIDRGIFQWSDFAAVTSRIDALLAVEGAHIDAIAACPFHPDFTPAYSARQDRWRKPQPQMILAIAEYLNADLRASWMVGDRARDIEAARAAGLGGGVRLTGDGDTVASYDGKFRVVPIARIAMCLSLLENMFRDRHEAS
jgi:D-glycero-D-manno-heptose 1,7-bisphosphate phosphatase